MITGNASALLNQAGAEESKMDIDEEHDQEPEKAVRKSKRAVKNAQRKAAAAERSKVKNLILKIDKSNSFPTLKTIFNALGFVMRSRESTNSSKYAKWSNNDAPISSSSFALLPIW